MAQERIGIFMVGGRRTGKTTILTSMKGEADEVVRGSNVTITSVTGIAAKELSDCQQYLKSYFIDPANRNSIFTADLGPTMAKSEYVFGVKAAGSSKSEAIDMAFYDVPGEWFEDGLNDEDIEEIANESQIFIIAVDTPSLMEDPGVDGIGKRHIEYNRVNMITEYLKNYITSEENRMVLFVPLKCEYYYHLTHDKFANPTGINYMKQIAEKIEESYKDLISFLTCDNMKNVCTVAITPILSVGGFDFLDFEEGIGGITGQRFTMNDDEPIYKPKWCEQPMFWTLSFVLKELERQMKAQNESEKKKGGLFGWFYKLIFSKKKKTVDEVTKLMLDPTILKKSEADGFKIINNPMNL